MIVEVNTKYTKLKPCPFCGKPVKLRRWLATGVYWIECENMDCWMRPSTDASRNYKWIIGAWNRRE